MFSKIRRIFLNLIMGTALALILTLFLMLLSSCAGFAIAFSRGSIIPSISLSTSSYYYSAPYAYIEGYRFYVYDYGIDPYVIYLGVPYRITIYSDGRVYAPRALVILLD